MGSCTSTPSGIDHDKNKNKLTNTKTAHTSLRKSDSVEHDALQVELMQEERRLRLEKEKEIEKEFTERLYAEKERLRVISNVMIERKISCESLLDTLDKNELEEIRHHEEPYRLQKQVFLKRSRQKHPAKKSWTLYNNLGAIHEDNLTLLGDFMSELLRRIHLVMKKYHTKDINKTKEKLLQHSFGSGSSIGGVVESKEGEDPHVYEGQQYIYAEHKISEFAIDFASHSPKKEATVLTWQDSFAPECSSYETFKNFSSSFYDHRDEMKSRLLTLPMLSLIPLHFHNISEDNIYDYDIPSGIVTTTVARTVVELYRKKGRLSYNSVHKLQRLTYRSLKYLPNISHIQIEKSDKLTIVGDLHGQLFDLLHILDTAGFPSSSNKYLFNGDFVDRGTHAVEIMCILMVLYVTYPDYIYFNRGNHEDYAICSAYGFQNECYEKYDELTFGMFIEVFQQIPMFAIVNDAVFVVHGGLFHTRDVLLTELNEINRSDFTLQDLPEGGEVLEAIPRSRKRDYLRQLQRDALWSDPFDSTGIAINQRGAGVFFGPDVTEEFLRNNGLKMIVRSHECVRSGYNQPYSGEARSYLVTIFSASDYGGAGNSAAYLVFQPRPASVNLHSSDLTETNGMSPFRVMRSVSMDSIKKSIKIVQEDTNDPNDTMKEDPATFFVEDTNLMYTVKYYFIQPPPDEIIYEDEDDVTVVNGVPKDTETLTPLHSTKSVDSSEYDLNTSTHSTDPNELKSRSHSPAGDNASPSNKFTDFNSAVSKAALEKQIHANRFVDEVVFGSTLSLYDIIFIQKFQLKQAFEEMDGYKEGAVTRAQWISVMHETLRLQLRWNHLLQLLIDENQYTTRSKIHVGRRLIDYNSFLDSFPDDYSNSHNEPTNSFVNSSFYYSSKIAPEGRTDATATAAELTSSEEPPHEGVKSGHPVSSIKSVTWSEALPDEDKPKEDLTTAASSTTTASNTNNITTHPTTTPTTTTTIAEGHVNNFVYHVNDTGTGTHARSSPIKRSLTDVDHTDTTWEYATKAKHNYYIPKDIINALYSNFTLLEAAFQFFDAANDGRITKEEFLTGCEILRLGTSHYDPTASSQKNNLVTVDQVGMNINNSTKSLSNDSAVITPHTDTGLEGSVSGFDPDTCEKFFHIMDIFADESVSINTFFELFRLSDSNLDDDILILDTTRPSTTLVRDFSMTNMIAKQKSFNNINILTTVQSAPSTQNSMAIKGVEIHVDEVHLEQLESNENPHTDI